jgi:hypothetical protein
MSSTDAPAAHWQMKGPADALPPTIGDVTNKARMDDILKMFFNKTTDFREDLRQSYSFIAGSAPMFALSSWKDSTKDFDGDIDIWSCTGYKYDRNNGKPLDMDRVRLNNMAVVYWEHALAKQGYEPDYRVPRTAFFVDANSGKETMGYDDLYSSAMANTISRVMHFIHPETKRRVQVVICREHDMRAVLNSFDYTFCAVAWDNGKLRSDYGEDILTRRGKIMNATRLLEKREEKYAARGFTVLKAAE